MSRFFKKRSKNLWIQLQGFSEMTNAVDELIIEKIPDGYQISDGVVGIRIGVYKSMERCEEIIKDIIRVVETRTHPNQIFCMPKD